MAKTIPGDPRHPFHKDLSRAIRDHVAAELEARGLPRPDETRLDFAAAGRRCSAVKRIRVIVCRHIARALPRCEVYEDPMQQRIDLGPGFTWTGGQRREILAEDLECALEAHLRGEQEGDTDAEREGTPDDLAWVETAVAYHHRESRALVASGHAAQSEKPVPDFTGSLRTVEDARQAVMA